MEDERIIELFWQRDEDALTRLDEKYGAFCFTIAFNVLSVREDAEECVNDAFRRAWESIPPERPRLLRAWIGKVTRNLALNRWNRDHAQKRGGLELLLSELEDCVPASESVERTVDAAELGKIISGWLKDQPELPHAVRPPLLAGRSAEQARGRVGHIAQQAGAEDAAPASQPALCA